MKNMNVQNANGVGEGFNDSYAFKDKATEEYLNRMRFDVTKHYDGPDYVFEYLNTPIFALGNIEVITAAEKNGKSLYATILCGAALKGEYMGYKCLKENVKIVYFDTEQEKGDVANLQERVHHIAGYDYHVPHIEFQVFNLLENEECDTPKGMRDVINKIIDAINPTIVIIDGVADLIKNLNDYDECFDLVREHLSMASKRHMLIFDIIHTNYGSDKMQGWLGTLLAKKSADAIRLTKSKDKESGNVTFLAEQYKTRHKDISDMQFKMDGSQLSIPVSLVEPIIITESYTLEKPKSGTKPVTIKYTHKEFINVLTFLHELLTNQPEAPAYTKLMEALRGGCKNADVASKNKADAWIQMAIDNKYLTTFTGPKNATCIRWKPGAVIPTEETDMPF